MTFEEQAIAEFEQEGVKNVRLRIAARLMGDRHIGLALQWLREKDAETARQALEWRTQDALIARQEKTIASAQADALKRLNQTILFWTKLSALGSLLGLLMACAAWLFPRH